MLRQDAVKDGKHRHGAATWCIWRYIRVVFDFSPFAPLCENMTSSTKPEVHNILHYRQKRTEWRPHVRCIENLEKFGRLVFETCERRDKQTNRQTDRLIAILRTSTKLDVNIMFSRRCCNLLKLERATMMIARTVIVAEVETVAMTTLGNNTLIAASQAPSTPATMSKQHSTLSKKNR